LNILIVVTWTFRPNIDMCHDQRVIIIDGLVGVKCVSIFEDIIIIY
jgi:hypothetical protein